MTKLYANFNFLKLRCNECNINLLSDIDLKKLAEHISYECSDLTEEANNRTLSYAFKCQKCKRIIKRDLSIERRKNILIVE